MKNSVKIIDVNLKGNTGLISSLDPKTAQVKINKVAIDEKNPSQANALKLAGQAMGALAEGFGGKRVTVIVPDSISVRAYEALKYRNETAENIAAHLFKPWMSKDAKADAYAEACGAYADGFKAAIEAGVNVNVVNARTLYRYELTAEDPDMLKALDDMETITLTNSINADLGIGIRQGEMSYANGEFRILKQTRNGQGGTFRHYYVSRMVTVTHADGKKERVASGIAAGMDDVTAANDSQTTLLNVLRFRAEAAKNLPRATVIKSFKVTVA